MSSFVKIGIVGKAHGLGGLFFLSGRDSLFELDVKYVYIEQGSSYKKMRVSKLITRSGRTVLGLDKIQSREDLEPYKGASVYVSREDIHLGKDEYLWNDIVGKEVKDSTGNLIGNVTKIDNFGASNIITVENSIGFVWMIPFTEEFFEMDFFPSDSSLTAKYDLSYYEVFKCE